MPDPELLRQCGRRLGVGFVGVELDAETRDHLKALQPGAIVLFARNIVSVAQVSGLIRDLRKLLGNDLLLCVDQEGGVVLRFVAELSVFPGNMALGATESVEFAEAQGRVMGAELRGVGFDVNFAPVCDLANEPENPGVGLRAFSGDPALASKLAAAFVRGAFSGGGATCAKHFPGLGGARVDPHLDMPKVDHNRDTIEGKDLAPFRALIEAGVETVMTAHARYPALDENKPAPFSRPIVHGMLRQALGFRGVIISDDLEMGALKEDGVGPNAVQAAQAGHDLFLVCHTPKAQLSARDALVQAIEQGQLDRDEHAAAVVRIEELCARSTIRRKDSAPTAEDGTALADDIARGSVARVDPGDGPLPFMSDLPMLVIAPDAADLTLVEGSAVKRPRTPADVVIGGLRLESFLPALRPMASDPSDGAIASAVKAADEFGRVLVLTFDAGRHAGQRKLLEALAPLGARLVVVHLRNPHDYRFAPPEAIQLQTWGFRECQLKTLVEVLIGTRQPKRHAPVP
jgi:beta-N-acetylhexosaminidase